MDLSAELSISDHILVELRRIFRAVDLHSRKLMQKCNLTVPQRVIMQEIEKNGAVSIGELARRVSLSNATLTGIIDRLEKRNLVSRSRSDTDRRRVFVSVTDNGRELSRSAPSPLQDQFIARLEGLNHWEQTQILSSLARVAEMMKAEAIDAAPILMSHPMSESSEIKETED